LVTNETGSTNGYFAVNSKEPENRKSVGFSPDKFMLKSAVSTGVSASELKPGKSTLVQMVPSATGLARIKVTEPGVYQIETHGILRTSISLRSPMRTRLNGLTVRGNGDNKILRQYLTPGDYYLEINADHQDRGPVTVTARKLDERFLGDISPMDTCRCDFTGNVVPVINVNIFENATYQFESRCPSGPVILRLEDIDGWPVSIKNRGIRDLQMNTGSYQLIQIASPYIKAAKLHCRTMVESEAIRGAGPHNLDLAIGANGFWEQDNDSPENHIWVLDLDADTTLTLNLSDGMEGKLVLAETQRGAMKVAEGKPFIKTLDAGIYELSVHPVIPDNMKPYQISVKTDPMINGTRQKITCPGHVDFRLSSDSDDSAIILQLDSMMDTRAVLTYPWSESSGQMEISDDIPGDWNPAFVVFQNTPSDYAENRNYRLHVEPVENRRVSCTVNLLVPEVEIISLSTSENNSGTQKVTSQGKLIKLLLEQSSEEPVRDGYWIVSAKSPGLFVMSGSNTVATEHLTVGVGADIKLWDVDNRGIEIDITSKFVTPVVSAEQSRNVNWSTVSLDGKTVAVAEISVESPGNFLFAGTDQTQAVYVPGAKPQLVTVDPIAAEKEIVLYTVLSPGVEPPAMTIERFVLNQSNQETEVLVKSVVDIQLEANETGIVRMGVHVAGNFVSKIRKFGPGGAHRLDLRTEFPEISSDVINTNTVKISLSVFDETTALILESDLGNTWLNPGQVAKIVAPAGSRRLAVSLDNGIVAFDADRAMKPYKSTVVGQLNEVTVYNMSLEISGIAWTTNPGKIMSLSPIPSEHGEGKRIFLAPSQLQPFKFKLSEPRTIGVSIKCSTGHVKARIVDPIRHVTGLQLDDAKGLVINTHL
ncbi:hypothetical protein K8T06_03935, partial [bacterium]|nr:hypothetical protein [bacterium]